MKKNKDNQEALYTESQEDFVEALLMLEEKGEPLESTRVAKLVNISKPAVHQMGHILIDRGLITREDYGDMYLTDAGRELAKRILNRHRVIHTYLTSLGIDEKTAEEDCCRIEHIISEETFQAIVRELNNKGIA